MSALTDQLPLAPVNPASSPFRAGLPGGVAISMAAHGAIIAAFCLHGLKRETPPPALPEAAAIQVMAVPAAPEAPPHETPPEPDQAVKAESAPSEKLDIPLVPTATDSIERPPKTPPVTAVNPPPPPPAAPSAPALPNRDINAAPTQGQPQAGPSRAQQRWDGQLLARLERKKRYPAAAQNAGQQDVVYVRISVDRTGQLLSSSIVKSRRFELLDSAVLELVRKVSPLPALPSEIIGDTYTVTVPIDFFVAGGRN